MPKIVLTNYPYDKYSVGDIVDLGEIKNTSLVGMGRAVWYEGPTKTKTKSKSKIAVTEENSSTPLPPASAKKKLLQNELQEQVAEEKKASSPKTSFWDKLK